VTAGQLAHLRRRPAGAAVISDFDGTLSPIVEDPDAAAPAPGALDLLHRLAGRYRTVAVVSGRPASFLAERLELASRRSGLLAVGLYGLEEVDAGGTVRTFAGAEAWRAAVERAAADADAALPPDVHVERKGLSVTLHWRRAPEHAAAAAELAERLAGELGLELRHGRMSAELSPPLRVDKGTVVERLCAGAGAALYAGDDLGDLPALAALGRLRAGGAVETLGVAVRSAEAPAELLAAADLVVDGVEGVLALLAELEEPGRD
jgi:trehalose 6-phosphate phosphatase